jgi:hypothetical protein
MGVVEYEQVDGKPVKRSTLVQKLQQGYREALAREVG